ncbi:MAG TPA: tricarballylate utilization 4Fe-4S protein TcuB [Burkholderiales bacterium]|nr:tricarballylate utilization 4Fe-4S protein TcuB [Burkholderiales bacterium]
MSSLEPLIAEAQRMLRICNACRYCEGYCAVFPALERRLDFTEADAHYLANLCHNCGSCLYACQYAPPHEFQLNFPRMLAQVRAGTYRKYAFPAALSGLFARNGLAVSLIAAVSLALMFLATERTATGSFYNAMPHSLMAGLFGLVFAAMAVSLGVSVLCFWRAIAGDPAGGLAEATADALTLKYLDGGGEGCTYPDEQPSFARRRFHHLTFYGFLLCFAATCVGALYHYVLARPAPYPLASLPVVLGTAGGIGLVVGPAGLLYLRLRRDPELGDAKQDGMDIAFVALLFLTAATGLALLALRDGAAMGTLLAVHLGVVLALFVTLPYGKFVHALYRFAALALFHIERKRPPPALGAE